MCITIEPKSDSVETIDYIPHDESITDAEREYEYWPFLSEPTLRILSNNNNTDTP